MTARTLLAPALLVVACGVAFTQSKPTPPPTAGWAPPPTPPAVAPAASLPALIQPTPPGVGPGGFTIPVAPAGLSVPNIPGQVLPPPKIPDEPPPEKSLDQLLDRLEALRAQKAELEKQEQDVVKEIRGKLEKQSERINRLGIAPPADAAVPPAIGLPAVPGAGALPGPDTTFPVPK